MKSTLLILSSALSLTVAGQAVMVKDIFPGSDSSMVSHMVSAGGTAFFTANDGSSGAELWKSNGTASGTALVKDINPGSAGSSPFGLAPVGNSVYFRASDGSNGMELWVSDGTTAGTLMVKDINPGSGS